MYPDTSSDSAIGMSNGGCVSSACTATMKMRKPRNCVRTYGLPNVSIQKILSVFWRTTISCMFMLPAWITTPMALSTSGSS